MPQDESTPTEPLLTIESKLVLWLIEPPLSQLIVDDQFQLSDAFAHLLCRFPNIHQRSHVASYRFSAKHPDLT